MFSIAIFTFLPNLCSKMSLNTEKDKTSFHSLFPMKIRAKCFQITHKTMALSILKVT